MPGPAQQDRRGSAAIKSVHSVVPQEWLVCPIESYAQVSYNRRSKRDDVIQTSAPKPPSSGLRVAAGVVAIVLGLWCLGSALVGVLMAIDYDGYAEVVVFTVLFLLLGLGSLASAITLLVQHRRKTPAASVAVLALAALALPAALMSTAEGFWGYFSATVTVLLAVPVFILLGISLVKEKRAI
jgi:peptidoglycan/LPS O-acetylase OafA/YrhL